MDLFPTWPQQPDRVPPEGSDRTGFLEALAAAAPNADRVIGRALGEMQAVRPLDSQGSSLLQTAQSLGGGALRLVASPHVDPVQIGGLSVRVQTLAMAGHNLPRMQEIGQEIEASLAAIRSAGGLEAGAVPALQRAEADVSHLQMVAGLPMQFAPPKDGNALTAALSQTVDKLNSPPWRGEGPRDAVSAAMLGIAGTTYSMAATAGGSWAPAPVRRAVIALSEELNRVVDGQTPTSDAADRLSQRLTSLVETTITRTGGLLGMDHNVRSMQADLSALPGLVERRLEGLRASLPPDEPPPDAVGGQGGRT